jgi:hypothetical protein
VPLPFAAGGPGVGTGAGSDATVPSLFSDFVASHSRETFADDEMGVSINVGRDSDVALAGVDGLSTRLIAATERAPIPTMEFDVGARALALIGRLQAGDPPVHVGERLADAGILSINPQTLRPQDDAVLVRCILNAFRSISP